jgi:hypothetical protein
MVLRDLVKLYQMGKMAEKEEAKKRKGYSRTIIFLLGTVTW